MKIYYEQGDNCPICNSKLEEHVNGTEDEEVFIICTQNSEHVCQYIGLSEDLNE